MASKTDLPAPTVAPGIAFRYGDVDVSFNDRRLVNLTQMWEAAGRPANKDPREWGRQAGASFIKDLAESLNVGKTHIMQGQRGKGGATHAHWQIALAYAKYLSNEFHRFVNEAFREWAEEKADPGLKLERAVTAYKRRGMSEDWIERRFKGVATRNALTSTMRDHNCKVNGPHDNPFAEATRSISLQLLGKTPHEIREEKGLPKSARTRDYLEAKDISAIEFAEFQAKELIRRRAADGNGECVDACRTVGKAVRQAMDAISALA